MGTFRNSVTDYLKSLDFHCKDETPAGQCIPDGMETFLAVSPDGRTARTIVLLSPLATTDEEAARLSEAAWNTVLKLKETYGNMPLILTEDRWNTARKMNQERIMAHMEVFFPIYARNCEVKRIDKKVAAEFLERTHSYGDASCRYRYGLFLKRHTGHAADKFLQKSISEPDASRDINPGTLVAVATFSNARKWIKEDKLIRSYEWTRYASLPGLRVNGGMGKILNTFIKEISPDDIMSYADLEWSEGKVYEQLGFILEGKKAPVCFQIDTTTWKRSVYRGQEMPPEHNSMVFFQNFGSAKYRLKLTEYK